MATSKPAVTGRMVSAFLDSYARPGIELPDPVGVRVALRAALDQMIADAPEGTVILADEMAGVQADDDGGISDLLQGVWDQAGAPAGEPLTAEQVQLVVAAGAEAAKISSAIDELAIAYGNADRPKVEVWDSAVFKGLRDRREELRSMLRDLG